MGYKLPQIVSPHQFLETSQSSPGEDGLQHHYGASAARDELCLNPLRARMGCNDVLLNHQTDRRNVSILSGRGWVATGQGIRRWGHWWARLNPLRARMGCNLRRLAVGEVRLDVSILSGRGWVATCTNGDKTGIRDSLSQSSPGEDWLKRSVYHASELQHEVVSILSGRGWVATS